MDTRRNFSRTVSYNKSSLSCYNLNQFKCSGLAIKSPKVLHSHRKILYVQDSTEHFYTPAEDSEYEQNAHTERPRKKFKAKTHCETSDTYNVTNNRYTDKNVIKNQIRKPNFVPYNNVNCTDDNRSQKYLKYFEGNEEKHARKLSRIKGPNIEKRNNNDKMTYCRPVIDYYNQDYMYKTTEDKRKLQQLVKKLVAAREREKQKVAWNNYINKLKIKHDTVYDSHPTTSRASNSPYNRITAKMLDDYHNTKFAPAPSDHCKNFLKDIYSSSIGADKLTIQKHKYVNTCSENNHQDNFTDNANMSGHTSRSITPKYKRKDVNNQNCKTQFNPYLRLPHSSNNPQDSIISYPCSSMGRILLKKRLNNSPHPISPQKSSLKKTASGDSPLEKEMDHYTKTGSVSKKTAILSSHPRFTKVKRNMSSKSKPCKTKTLKHKTTTARHCIKKKYFQIYSDISGSEMSDEKKTEKITRSFQVNPISADDSTNMSIDNKISELRGIQCYQTVASRSLKNIEHKLDALISQMHTLLCKSKSIGKRTNCKSINLHNVLVQTANTSYTDKSCQNGECTRKTASAQDDSSLNVIYQDKNNKTHSNITDQLDSTTLHPQTFSINVNRYQSELLNEIRIEEHKHKSSLRKSWRVNSSTSHYSDIHKYLRDNSATSSLTKASSTSYNPSKINDILIEEMDKSDKVKRDIADILNGDRSRPCDVKIMIDVPTKERCTNPLSSEITRENLPVIGEQIVPAYSNLPTKGITMAVNTDPLGLISLLKFSTATISRLLSFVHFDYQSLLPLAMPRTIATYPCTICNTPFRKCTDLSDHIRAHQLKNSKDCCVCRHLLDRNLNRRVALFTCQYCGKSFARAYCCELHEQSCAKNQGIRHDIPENLSYLS